MNDDFFKKLLRWSLIIGVIAAVVAVVGLVTSGSKVFLQAYLFAYLFWLWLSLGGLSLSLLHYLVAGKWGRPIRAITESASKTIWLMLVLFIPIVIWLPSIYPWAGPQTVLAPGDLNHKQYYLNIPFFLVRAAIYFIIWLALAHRTSAMAQNEANYVDPDARRRFRTISAVGLILYALTVTYASIDWIMSLQPDWYSTMFGFLTIGGQALSAFAFAAVLLPVVVRIEPVASMITPTHIRDIGAYLLTTVVFWAYLAFMQFLIIWLGNISHEVTWYAARTTGGWEWIPILVAIFDFAVPFFVLISLRAKRSVAVVAGMGLLILLMRLFDMFWQVMPSFHPGALTIEWLDLVTPIAIGGLWLAVFAWFYLRTPALAPEPLSDQVIVHQPGEPEGFGSD